MSVVLAHVYRGQYVESMHRGDWVIVDVHGNIVHSSGDPHKNTFWRSSAKPFQAIPVVESGAAQHFGFTERELAIMCASHSGEDYHCNAVSSILKKIGLTVSHLKCGIHPPVYKPAADILAASGEQPTEIHCNCSGKHSGMLALCQFFGWDLETYLHINHPLQQLTLEMVSEYSGIEKREIGIGVDGCGVPVFRLPLSNMARAWALLSDPSSLETSRQASVKTIATAMRSYPEMVAGTNRICTDIMRGFRDISLIAKAGAEAVYCLGLPEKGWGLALKIEDGNSRAIPAIILHILGRLGYSAEGIRELQDYYPLLVKNHHKEIIGKIVAEG